MNDQLYEDAKKLYETRGYKTFADGVAQHGGCEVDTESILELMVDFYNYKVTQDEIEGAV